MFHALCSAARAQLQIYRRSLRSPPPWSSAGGGPPPLELKVASISEQTFTLCSQRIFSWWDAGLPVLIGSPPPCKPRSDSNGIMGENVRSAKVGASGQWPAAKRPGLDAKASHTALEKWAMQRPGCRRPALAGGLASPWMRRHRISCTVVTAALRHGQARRLVDKGREAKYILLQRHGSQNQRGAAAVQSGQRTVSGVQCPVSSVQSVLIQQVLVCVPALSPALRGALSDHGGGGGAGIRRAADVRTQYVHSC